MPDNLDFLLDQPSTPRTSYWVWATVTSTSPLQIRLDGDSAPLLGSPRTLVNPLHLSVEKRVRVEMAPTTAGRQAIVHGPTSLETDTGLVTSGVVSAAAGVSIGSYRFRRVGPWVTCDISLTATVAYTAGPTGDISNSVYNAQINDSRFLPTGGPQALATHGSSGRLLSAAVETGGRILVGALPSNASVAVGDTLRMGGVYFAG